MQWKLLDPRVSGTKWCHLITKGKKVHAYFDGQQNQSSSQNSIIYRDIQHRLIDDGISRSETVSLLNSYMI